jgi:hypothetical protein
MTSVTLYKSGYAGAALIYCNSNWRNSVNEISHATLVLLAFIVHMMIACNDVSLYLSASHAEK